MQKNEKKLKKIRYDHDNHEYIVLNKCPHCNLEIHPTTQNTFRLENNSFKLSVISLTCPSCKNDYFIFNDDRNEAITNEKYLVSIPKYSFNESSLIQNTSNKFQNLYTQSTNCELLGYYDIAFFGYIKSLEILLKDIAILEHPDSEDIILFCNVIACLEQFHSTNIHLFSKKLLEVLKNDYLHYQKSVDFYTNSELVKDCIDYFLLYLELLLKTKTLNAHRKPSEE
ncbi:MAG TPA: hypothetical protein VNS08_05295 [Ureibacillus sp.]|nr:hypothetical protein [Ureibacillus sp.]